MIMEMQAVPSSGVTLSMKTVLTASSFVGLHRNHHPARHKPAPPPLEPHLPVFYILSTPQHNSLPHPQQMVPPAMSRLSPAQVFFYCLRTLMPLHLNLWHNLQLAPQIASFRSARLSAFARAVTGN